MSIKIAVIAANGRSGRAFVETALAAGHYVNAGVRSKNSFENHPNLKIVKCDATNKNQLKDLIQGQEVVASFIGHSKNSPFDVQTIATQKIIEVMKECSIKRLISLTGTGVRFKGDKITFQDWFLNSAIKIIDPLRIKDGINHAQMLKDCDLKWTIIRVLKLSNVPSRPFVLSEHGPTKLFVNRKDVAQAALQVIEQASFIKQAPIISKIKNV